MQILLVTDALPDLPRGGQDRHVAELRGALGERGHEVRVWEGGAPGRAGGLRAVFGRPPPGLPSADVVHIHSLRGQPASLVAAFQVAGARVYWTHHDLFARCSQLHLEAQGPCGGPWAGLRCAVCPAAGSRLARAAMPARQAWVTGALRRVDGHVAPSRWMAEQLRQAGARRLTVLAPAPPPSRRAAPPAAGLPRLVVPGTLRRSKGADRVLRAIERVQRPLRIDVAGDAPDAEFRAEIEALARRSRHTVTLSGPWSRLVDRLDGATAALFLPRARESFGRTASEALAAGVPVLGPSGGGIAEQIVPGVNGLLVDPADPAAIAQAIARIVELAPSLRARAWPRVPTLDDHVDGLLAFWGAA